MALSANVGALTDELIIIITNTSDKGSRHFHKLKSLVERTLKKNNAGRTDHLDVAKRLDGLQEKFQVLNKDALSDALRIRLEELNRRRSHRAPELLSLLLELSDRPAIYSKIEDLDLLQRPASPPPLTWKDIYASDPPSDQEGIWQDVDFAALSSDDDLSDLSSDVSIPRIIPQRPKPPLDDFKVPDSAFLPVEDETLLSRIQDLELWRNRVAQTSQPMNEDDLCLTEFQVIRETIFMLQDLPTVLFWYLDGNVEVDRRFRLRHVSPVAFGNLLRSFGVQGAKLHVIRQFVKRPQKLQFMQMFQREVEFYLSNFTKNLSHMEAEYSRTTESSTLSLIRLYSDIYEETYLLRELSDIINKLGDQSQNEPFLCLDLLYELVCSKQACGDDKAFQDVAKIFFKCFEVYARPIRLWIETGLLDRTLGSFFVSDSGKQLTDLRTLWHEWFTLDEAHGQLYAPSFFQPAAKKIFTTGRSMIFLRRLGIDPELLEAPKCKNFSYEDICSSEFFSPLVPFTVLLERSFDRLIDSNHSFSSNLLRKQLDEQCGLWVSLEALEYIYLGKDMSLSSIIDHEIFDLIDKGIQSWNDRFFLTELAQGAFSSLACIDPSRLIIRSKQLGLRDFEHHCRSVQILKAIAMDYILPWPVANIITKQSLLAYRRVSTFLMQIRRAKYVVERQRLLRSLHSETESEKKDDVLGYSIRHHLVWFLNVLYAHLTQLVICSSTANMKESLSTAKDVDGMIAAHQSYTSSLEDQCLLSSNLAPIYQAVTSLLDLCIHFSDIQISRHGDNQFDQGNSRSLRSSTGHRYRASGSHRSRHSRSRDDESSSVDDDGICDTDDSMEDEGNLTSVSFLETSYRKRLIAVRDKFERLCSFITAGLRGMGRVDGHNSWEILAEKLEWRKSTGVIYLS
ncbi:gamma-tubulin complex component GCP5 [Histoplasma capsulatum var. duboisii H88]|uniref:Spindle pole body component n=1 Tax=Ajellomyces capsulatus (strain H88) TaxID=544711 RepID=A0A8A1LFF5_AJEC8|nr:gamma-tubulin complex component GCP5 [Histoplasma capsulatum var. duboisii H88]